MLILRGAPALSAFRLDKLAQKLAAIDPAIRIQHTEYLHFAELRAPLTPEREAILARLLHYGPAIEEAGHVAGDAQTAQLLLVVPRPGTISPWSSKATDIAHNCGLEEVKHPPRPTACYMLLPATLTPG